jgi:predicted DNA-binding protein
MKDKVYGVRMEIQLYEELEGEAKNLGQSVASLIRNLAWFKITTF